MYVTVISDGVSVTKFREHQGMIDRRGVDGWQYVGWVPIHIASVEAAQMDLVLEREA